MNRQAWRWILLGTFVCGVGCGSDATPPASDTRPATDTRRQEESGTPDMGRDAAPSDSNIDGSLPADTGPGDGPATDSPTANEDAGTDSRSDVVVSDTLRQDTLRPDTLRPDTLRPDVSVPRCGDGNRDPGEECDDGNLTNLDGCDASCNFEQVLRADYLTIETTTSTACDKNALGTALSQGLVPLVIGISIDGSIADGGMSVLFKLLGLDDLSGTADASVQLGFVSGNPAPGASYDGTSDLDWWYSVDAASVDSDRMPTTLLDASIANHVLTAGPGRVDFPLRLQNNAATMSMSSARMRITLAGNSQPTISNNGQPPGHVAAENLDPGLTSFDRAGQPTGQGSGYLCGNTSAASFAAIPIPSALTGSACGEGFTTNNSLLDLLVTGCTALFNKVVPTQPDTDASGSEAPVYRLIANATHRVTTCQRISNSSNVPLSVCLADAAFSTYLRLAAGRVIPRN